MSSTDLQRWDPRHQAESLGEWADVVLDGISPALVSFLRNCESDGPCCPQPEHWFSALRHVESPNRVRVVILGQDPYHGPGQANGLAFSVARGQAIPPSLRNMYREIQSDVGGTPPVHGDLSAWAEQGVLLLNEVLSVAEGKAGSHQGQGWERLTGSVLSALTHRPVAFLLWGRHARSHAEAIRSLHPGHLILEAPHPSPLSAHRGFFGCGHFSQVNRWLEARGEVAVDWVGEMW